MTPLLSWDPCLADIDRGVAFFDGITIEADRITDPRWDRVLPVMEEEQIFMCRMMAPLLQAHAGARVLDIGTGSGVFAIYAAKLGCRVVAIDISARALRFARQNARINQIPFVDTDPRPGEIQFLRCSHEHMRGDRSFDVVILAAPYNPTCKGFRPALHAEAGPLGQKSFEEQLPQAARLLKPGGLCIGNQMLLVDGSRELEIRTQVQKVFPGAMFSYLRILPEDIPVEEFLRGQYASYLRPELDLKPDAATVDTYIRRNSHNGRFALVYFELRSNQDDPAARPRSPLTFTESHSSARPNKTWADRVKLHRRIIEHTSRDHSFPSPALFLDVDALPDFPRTESGVDQSRDDWQKSVLRYIETWLAKTELLQGESRLFDLVLVDTAPWYPTPEGRSGLRQESVAWVALDQGGNAIAKRMLASYQDNTARLQRTCIGPFLHRHFTGQNEPNEWRSIQFTVHEQCTAADVSAAVPGDSIVSDMVRALDECDVDGPRTEIVAPNSLLGAAYTHSNLETLDVPAANLREYDRQVRKRMDRLREVMPRWAAVSDEALYPIDLDLCHQAMHQRLDVLLRQAGFDASGPSTLIGIPVSLASPASNPADMTLPDNYRGGIWIYAIARGDWRPESEWYLLDLARLLSMRYETEYSELAAKELRRIGRGEATSAIFHQIPKDFGALEKCLADLRQYASSEGASIDAVRLLIPNTDAMAFMIMAADAAVGRSSYQLLPRDIPSALEHECSFALAQDVFRRLVIPYVDQRVTRPDVPRSADFVAGDDLLQEVFRNRFPLPRLEPFETFRIPSGADAYVWLLLALRSAAYHAYIPVITGRSLAQGFIRIRYSGTERAITIVNSGCPPSSGEDSAQIGWKRDLSVFKRAGQRWDILECGAAQYSAWVDAEQHWITVIKYIGELI